MKKVLYFLSLLLLTSPLFAQQESGDISRGNRQYNNDNFVDAEIDYRRALEKNNKSFEAHFNLGDALFKQDKYKEAQDEFQLAEHYADGKDRKAAVYHNIGNAQFAQQQYAQAIESYKQALKNNPKDNDTRYNLVKALQMLQQQEQQQNNSENSDNSDNSDNSENSDNSDNSENSESSDNSESPDPSQMDKETAEQLLQALEQDEQETQEKVQRQQTQGNKRVEKNW